MVPFLLLLHNQDSLSMYIGTYRAIQILMSLFLCNMSNVVCVFIYFILLVYYLHSPNSGYNLCIYDSPNISMIEWCIHWEETKYLLLCFNFCLLRCWWNTDCWQYHSTALWTLFFSFKYPCPIKSIFSMDFTSLFCITKRKSSLHNSMHSNRMQCSLYFERQSIKSI